MYTISKEFHFSSSHQLIQLPAGHQCARLHGHNYIVIVELAAIDVDPFGMVLDYGELDRFGDFIKRDVDHRHLNEVFREPRDSAETAAIKTTAENLARIFYEILEEDFKIIASAVIVKETEKTRAEYRPVRSLSSTLPASHWPHKDPNAQ